MTMEDGEGHQKRDLPAIWVSTVVADGFKNDR